MALCSVYAGGHKGLTFLGLALSAVAMLLSMAPVPLYLAGRARPDRRRTGLDAGTKRYPLGLAGLCLCGGRHRPVFSGLMCTHLAAFRTAANIRKRGVAHVMQAPLGFFDANASGLIRSRLDAAAAETETLLAHNLADIVGTSPCLCHAGDDVPL